MDLLVVFEETEDLERLQLARRKKVKKIFVYSSFSLSP